jgi:hypothetical protein
MLLIKPKIAKIVDECMQPHIETVQHNKDALILQEIQNKEQKDQISSMKSKINNLEKRLKEQEQYSRRTSLRFNNVKVPTNGNNVVKTPIDTDSLVLGICKNQRGVQLSITDIGRSHPIGEIRDGKISIIVRFLTYRQTLISTDFEYLTAWSYRWLVKFNPNKIDIMIFSTRHLENNSIFDFGDISLSPVHMHKHLGVIFSSDCKWTKHSDVLIVTGLSIYASYD